jgi:rhodanese-related sulfurtransferase
MNGRKFLLEALTLVVAAVLCAVVANAFASRDRKMALAGNYPNALKVPSSQAATPSPIVANTTRFDTTANEIANTTAPPASTSMRVAVPNTTSVPATTTAPTTTPSTTSTQRPATSTPAPLPPSTVNRPPSTAASTDALLSKFAPHEKQPYIEIHGDDVAFLHSRGALFLDARRTSVYEAGHIAGAQPYSVWEADVDEKVNKLYETRGSDPKLANEPIVIYCSGGDCEDSHMLAQKLWGVQFNNVYVYKDGFPDWEKRGGAVHKGSAP